MPKIDVITVKLTCHIPVDLGDLVSVQLVASLADGLRVAGTKVGQTSIETRVNRVPEPEPVVESPEAVAAGVPPIPHNLRRTAKAETKAAD